MLLANLWLGIVRIQTKSQLKILVRLAL